MRSLYARIFLSFWAVMALVVAGAVAVTWLILIDRTADVSRTARDLVGQAAAALQAGDAPGLARWLDDARRRNPGLRVFVIDERGRDLGGRRMPPFVARHLHRAPEWSLPPGPGRVAVQPPQPLPVLETADGRRYAVLVLPPRGVVGVVGLPETRWAVLLFALAVTGVASWLLARSITRPVDALSTATRAIADGDLAARVHGPVAARADELGVLARDFDAMAARLQELLRSKERLLRDISHELRSPLARMRVALGLARQPGGDLERQLARAETETERLDRLIGEVLRLSRLDAKAGALAREELDLAALVGEVARDAAFEAQARGVAIDWQPPAAPVPLRADPTLLASAVENVVRNAIRYTAPATAIAIRVTADAGRARVLVRDRGPGVPADELERIFEPFHRVAESRERDSGGDGIGLAIASRVLAAHGGRASAANAPGGGLELLLELPVG